MPSRWTIALHHPDPGTIRWEHLHAVVSRWFDDDTAHHDKVKGWSISPPRDSPDGPLIEIGLVDDALQERLHSHACPGAQVRFGSTVVTTSTPHQIAAAGWEDLGKGHRDRAWCLHFAAPLTFRRGNRFTPLPAPTPILGSLRRSWNTWAPPALALDLDLAHEPAWVTDIDGHNEVLTVNRRTTSGFVGRLRLETDAPDPTADAINRAVHLAPFAGVGAFTTRCFGVTRLEPTWQPRWQR